MRRRYYDEVGFDWETGNPSAELLRAVDLEEMVPEVWGAGAARGG
jgi:hypothetical protein